MVLIWGPLAPLDLLDQIPVDLQEVEICIIIYTCSLYMPGCILMCCVVIMCTYIFLGFTIYYSSCVVMVLRERRLV